MQYWTLTVIDKFNYFFMLWTYDVLVISTVIKFFSIHMENWLWSAAT